jgi:DNA-binding MurR/RpiR family transcriptional regulator
MTNVEIKIKSSYSSLTEAEKKAADYFLAHVIETCNTPIAELAEASGVSPAAWVRLCKDLGYNGLKDMRTQLYIEYSSHVAASPHDIHFTDISEGGSTDEIIHSLNASGVDALNNTAKLLDTDELDKAVDVIMKADTVMLFGMGASGLVAEDLYEKFIRIGKRALFCSDGHMQLSYSATVNPKDAAIFISNTGETREVLEALGKARELGCHTIGITRYAKNSLSSLCDIVLFMTSTEGNVRSGATSSRLAQLMIVDILFTLLASKDYKKIQKPLEESYDMIRNHQENKF